MLRSSAQNRDLIDHNLLFSDLLPNNEPVQMRRMPLALFACNPVSESLILRCNLLDMGYFDKVDEILEAGAPVIMLRTTEFERSYAGLKKWCKRADGVLYRWTCVEGLLEMSLSFDTVMAVDERVSDIAQVLVEIERRQDSSEVEVFALEGVYDFMYRADVKALLRKLLVDIPKYGSKKRVVLLNPVPELPMELCNAIPVLELPQPDKAELGKALDVVLKAMGGIATGGLHDAILEAAEGMTLEAATLAFKIAGLRCEFDAESPAVVRECNQLYLPAQPYK